MRNYDLSPLLRQWIGFDKLANALQTTSESQSFPPYNIEKSDDNHYRITLALAGFRQHQGLVSQAFSLSFTLAENMEVSGATFNNGLLHIDLTRNEPEVVIPQRIAISERPALDS